MRSFILFSFLLPTTVAAQTTFAPIGATWTYTQRYVSSADTNLFVIECVSDTVIQGRTCSKLVFTTGWNACMPFNTAITWQGDSVLMFQPLFSQFATLYVFGQPPGFQWETIIDYPFGTDTMRWTVTDTGHTVIDGVVLRTQDVVADASGPYATESLNAGTVVERLGDLNYLFPWISGVCDSEINGPLRCYEDPEIAWANPLFPQCAIGLGIPEPLSAHRFVVHPTLLATGESIRIIADPGLVQVLDASGRILLKQLIAGTAYFTPKRTGTYLVLGTMTNGEVYSQKIIVTD